MLLNLCNCCSVFSCSDDADVSSSFIEVPACSAASPVDDANSTTETASGAHGYLQTPVHSGDLNCDARSQVQCLPFEPYNL